MLKEDLWRDKLAKIDFLIFIKENTTAIAAFSVFFVLGVYLKELVQVNLQGNQYYDILRLIPFLSFIASILIGISLYRAMQANKKRISMIFQQFRWIFLLLVAGIVTLFLLLYQDIVATAYLFIVLFGPLIIFHHYYETYKIKSSVLWNVVLSVPILIAILWGNDVYSSLTKYFPSAEWAKLIVMGIFFGILLLSVVAVGQLVSILFGGLEQKWVKYFRTE